MQIANRNSVKLNFGPVRLKNIGLSSFLSLLILLISSAGHSQSVENGYNMKVLTLKEKNTFHGFLSEVSDTSIQLTTRFNIDKNGNCESFDFPINNIDRITLKGDKKYFKGAIIGGIIGGLGGAIIGYRTSPEPPPIDDSEVLGLFVSLVGHTALHTNRIYKTRTGGMIGMASGALIGGLIQYGLTRSQNYKIEGNPNKFSRHKNKLKKEVIIF